MVGNRNLAGLEHASISQNVTIVPRLEYSNVLLFEIIGALKTKQNEIKKSNCVILGESNYLDKTGQKALETEKTIAFSIEILSQIQKRTGMISGITSIPKILPSAVPMIRVISAHLYSVLPECSQKLSELSVHLGSIILDSATLTKAKFDFSLSNKESAFLLDEVKLMVDSKINNQYPNLDFFKP
jgi:hypothetical protein